MAFHNAPALFLDGKVARKQNVSVTSDVDGRSLEISDGTGALIASWSMADLRQVRDDAGFGVALYLAGDDDAARLYLNRPQDVDMIRQIAPKLNSRDMTGRLWGKVAFWFGGAALAMWLMIFVIVPALAGRLAVLIPPAQEAALGNAVLTQFENFLSESDDPWACTGAEGQAALTKMATIILGDEELPYDLVVQAVDHEMFNAFALPGGQVVFMRGLIDAATSAEQVAGVLAHEIGHVANRDPMRNALRAAGTAGLVSLLIGDLSGGTLIALGAEQAISASYSRKAEALADDYGLDLLKAANVSPEAFAEFFDLLIEEGGDMPAGLEWASTHPASGGRADKARAAVLDNHTYDGIVTDAEWQAIKTMCDA